MVFSSTLTEPLTWVNTRLVTGDAVEAVRAMKEDSRTEIRTLGSVSLCRSLITAELVDPERGHRSRLLSDSALCALQRYAESTGVMP